MYEFDVNGGVYRSSRVAFIDRANIDYQDWLQLANGLPKEGAITVYYNPDDPNESVLKAGNAAISWSGVGFGALFGGFATFWMIAWWCMSNWLPDRLMREVTLPEEDQLTR